MDTKRPLKVGLVLPIGEKELGGGAPRWSDLLAMARTAENVGFDSLWMPDHLLFRFEEETEGIWECWTVLSAVAACTSRVELGPIVACTSFRNPALLAKMVDTLDEVSGGRLILGLGAGWHEPEYCAFGYPFDHRVSRFEEALIIIRSLLREGRVDFSGRYYEARECELRPRGPRAEGPPVLIGSTGARMMRLLAKYGDMWNVWFSRTKNSAGNVTALSGVVDEACVEVGRDPGTITRTAGVLLNVPGREDSRREGVTQPISGSAEKLAEVLQGYASVGISHVQVAAGLQTPGDVEKFAPVLEMLDRG